MVPTCLNLVHIAINRTIATLPGAFNIFTRHKKSVLLACAGIKPWVFAAKTVCECVRNGVLVLSTNRSASTTTTIERRSVGADLAVRSYVVQRVVRTLGRAFDVVAEVVRISRCRLSDPIEVHVEHRMVGGLRFGRGCGGGGGGRMTIIVSTVTVFLLVLIAVMIVPEGRTCGANASA